MSSFIDRRIKNCQVSVANIKNVHELSLVLMDTLDLDIVHCINRDIDTGVIFDPFFKFYFVVSFNIHEFLNKILVGSIWFKLA